MGVVEGGFKPSSFQRRGYPGEGYFHIPADEFKAHLEGDPSILKKLEAAKDDFHKLAKKFGDQDLLNKPFELTLKSAYVSPTRAEARVNISPDGNIKSISVTDQLTMSHRISRDNEGKLVFSSNAGDSKVALETAVSAVKDVLREKRVQDLLESGYGQPGIDSAYAFAADLNKMLGGNATPASPKSIPKSLRPN